MNPPFAKLIRRTHMYLALFLTPWMIAYALSGLVLNHFDTVRSWYGGKYADFEKIEERPYTAAFSAEETPRMIAEQVLDDLGLAGSFGVPPGGSTPARLVIMRNASCRSTTCCKAPVPSSGVTLPRTSMRQQMWFAVSATGTGDISHNSRCGNVSGWRRISPRSSFCFNSARLSSAMVLAVSARGSLRVGVFIWR